jgi:hypothetical protein
MARPRNPNKLVPQPFVIQPELREQLKALSTATRVPVNAYLNEAAADVLAKYAHVLKPKRSKRK